MFKTLTGIALAVLAAASVQAQDIRITGCAGSWDAATRTLACAAPAAPPVVQPAPIPPPPTAPLPVGSRAWSWAGPKVATIDTPSRVAIGFDVPPGGPRAAGSIATIEYPGSSIPTYRVLSLSQTAGDFTRPWPFRQVGVNPGTSFSVGDIFPSWPALAPGRWFINIADSDSAGNVVSGGRVSNLRITLTKPEGY